VAPSLHGAGRACLDLTRRFPLIANTLARLRSRPCIIDGEAVACDDKALPRSISSVTTALTTRHSSTPLT
jgi:ATP-dependent DNA ligase